jgi:hypothetical protein
MQKNIFYFLLLIIAIFSSACNKDDEENTSVIITFSHEVNGSLLVFDSLKYVNAAGNLYLVTDIQYFISDITFYKAGRKHAFTSKDFIKYVDTNIPTTQLWNFPVRLPVGTYDSLSFTFGIDSTKNQSNIFVNPPERDMFWPEMMGGGYHYMKLNGMWIPAGQTQPAAFNLHLGIGQIYANDTSSTIIKLIHNDFKVTLHQTFHLTNEANKLGIAMDVNSWFDTPEVYNLDYWGAHIMQNQDAIHTVCLNGEDAFSLRQYLKDK